MTLTVTIYVYSPQPMFFLFRLLVHRHPFDHEGDTDSGRRYSAQPPVSPSLSSGPSSSLSFDHEGDIHCCSSSVLSIISLTMRRHWRWLHTHHSQLFLQLFYLVHHHNLFDHEGDIHYFYSSVLSVSISLTMRATLTFQLLLLVHHHHHLFDQEGDTDND